MLIAAVLAAVTLAARAQDRDAGSAPVAKPAPAWIVGDLHVHVSPPDADGHSALSVSSALASAREQGLDFVVFAPHAARDVVRGADGAPSVTGQQLVRTLAARDSARAARPVGEDAPPSHEVLAVAGWEFTRGRPGHLGIAFTDVAKLPAGDGPDVSAAAVRAGALVIVEHPFFRPVESPSPLVKKIDADRSWRPFTEKAAGSGADDDEERWNAIEVWHDRSALVERLHRGGRESFPDTQMVKDALSAWDRVTLAERRRIVAVGGSDAHGRFPYTVLPMALTSVLVTARDENSLRDALLAAHVTFGPGGGVAARGFRATSDVEGERAGIGDTLRAERTVRLAWDGKAQLVENGVRVGEFDGGATRALSAPGAFTFWRIECAGDAYSNMIYANLR